MNAHEPLASLFKDSKELTDAEEHLLEQHLQNCDTCRTANDTLHALEKVLRSDAIANPTVGFTDRWFVRLQVSRAAAHRKQTKLTIAGIGLALLFLGALLLYRVWPLIQSPHLLLMSWVYRLLEVYAYLGTITEFTRVLVSAAPSFLPVLVWLFSVSMLIFMMVLLFLSHRLITVNRG